MPFHHFPANFVYWEKLESHDKIKEELLPIILKKNDDCKNNPFDACDFNTSYFRDNRMLTENKFLHDTELLKSVVFKPVEKMINEYNNLKMSDINLGNSLVQTAWWNVYSEKQYQELHAHHSTPMCMDDTTFYPSFSIIYVLNDENERSSVLFKQPPPLPIGKSCDEHVFNTSMTEDIKEGTVMIFPYGLYHLVLPCIKPGRVTVAYNIYSEWCS